MCTNPQQLHQHVMPSRKLCKEGRLSLICYLGTAALVLMPSVLQIYYGIVPKDWGAQLWGLVLYFALISMSIRFVLRNTEYQIAIRASFLGFVEAISILLICFCPTIWKHFAVYGFFIAFFHYSEFLALAWCNPKTIAVGSFILNYSRAFNLFEAASWLEFVLEVYFLPNFKDSYYLWLVGVAFCVIGEVVRKTAINTAGKSFSHKIQHEKSDDHKLITHGIYAYARHPTYVGVFWWNIGTQIILMNPFCILAYTVATWKFLKNRIYGEEFGLLNIFGSDYKVYQQNVPTGLPFIRGNLFGLN